MTAQARMDCCARARHDCPDQSMADDCCARSQERQQDRSSGLVFVLTAPLPTAALFTSWAGPAGLSQSSLFWFESRIDGRPQRPTYLLTSVLLI
jgi:hypothetical protein